MQVDNGVGMSVMSWSLCEELKLIDYLEGEDLVQTANGDTIRSKGIIQLLLAYVVDVHYCFDVIIIDGLARPMLVRVNLLRVLRATIDFDMATLTILGQASTDTRVIMLARHVKKKGVRGRL